MQLRALRRNLCLNLCSMKENGHAMTTLCNDKEQGRETTTPHKGERRPKPHKCLLASANNVNMLILGGKVVHIKGL